MLCIPGKMSYNLWNYTLWNKKYIYTTFKFLWIYKDIILYIPSR